MPVDIAHGVAQLCANQDMIVQALAWVGGVTPIASAFAWCTAKWSVLPEPAQRILQVVAGNVLHAILGEPKKTA